MMNENTPLQKKVDSFLAVFYIFKACKLMTRVLYSETKTTKKYHYILDNFIYSSFFFYQWLFRWRLHLCAVDNESVELFITLA